MPKSGMLVVVSAVANSFLKPLKCMLVPDASMWPGGSFLLTGEQGGCKALFKVSKVSHFSLQEGRLEMHIGTPRSQAAFPCPVWGGEESRCDDSRLLAGTGTSTGEGAVTV